MTARHTLNVSLTEPLRDFVVEQVLAGRYQTASEVVRSALRLLQTNLDGSPGELRSPRMNALGLPAELPEPRPSSTSGSKR